MLGAQHHFESCRFKDAPSRTHQHTQGHFLKGIIFLSLLTQPTVTVSCCLLSSAGGTVFSLSW